MLAVAAVGEAGCQSGPCSSCGPVATTWRGIRETVARPFRHTRNTVVSSGGCCGGEVGIEGAPVQYGTPTVVAPGAVVTPAPSTTTSPGTVDSLPPALDPIPQGSPGPPPSNSEVTPKEGSKSPTGKTSYEASRPRFGDDASRPSSLTRSFDPSPAPTSRSAQGLGPSSPADSNSLDNLPPLEIPRDTASRGPGPVASPSAPRQAAGELAGGLPPDPTGDPAPGLPASAPETSVAPGIRRFAGVASKLAGGSLPTPAGLDWLVDKGYKTVLDLRDDTQGSSAFIDEVTRRGLRYLALPVSLNTLDALHISRFESELALSDGRPLYFCDTDGTRPGALWFIHRMTVDKVDADVARRDAEELGLSDASFWKAAQTYLDGLRPVPAAPPGSIRPPQAAPASTPAPAATPTDSTKTTPPKALSAPPPAGGSPPPVKSTATDPAPVPRDPDAWKPLAALLVTGIGFPLAYASRAAIPVTFRVLSRASLPGPGRSQRSLPGVSGG